MGRDTVYYVRGATTYNNTTKAPIADVLTALSMHDLKLIEIDNHLQCVLC
jgi:hypothetical protein